MKKAHRVRGREGDMSAAEGVGSRGSISEANPSVEADP